jgi:hypothetical protein
MLLASTPTHGRPACLFGFGSLFFDLRSLLLVFTHAFLFLRTGLTWFLLWLAWWVLVYMVVIPAHASAAVRFAATVAYRETLLLCNRLCRSFTVLSLDWLLFFHQPVLSISGCDLALLGLLSDWYYLLKTHLRSLGMHLTTASLPIHSWEKRRTGRLVKFILVADYFNLRALFL